MAMPERGYAADRLDPSLANYALTLTDGYAGNNGKFITEAFNNFTVEFLVKPVIEHEIDVESNTGFGGTYGQKYVIFPDYAGDNSDGNAGMGVSVGTNGVSVYEHAEGHMPAILVWASPTPLTTWTHVAVVYNNKLPSLYINGVLVHTAGAASPRNKIYPTYQFPGGVYGTQGGGQLDEVRIWGVARSQAEIAANMNTEVAPNSANLLGYWPMNEGGGLTLTDVSGHNRNIDLTNGGYAIGNWTSMGTAAVAAKAAYRYGFNSKEDDKDISEGAQDYGMRISDSRLGRFLSVDPITKKYPELTPYQFASNRPIDGIDQDGLEWQLSSTVTYRGAALIKKTNEYRVKIDVINHTTMSDADLKKHMDLVKFGAERILQHHHAGAARQEVDFSSAVKIDLNYVSKGNPTSAFTLEAVNFIEQDYRDKLVGTITLAKTQVIGNTQQNNIVFGVNQEVSQNGMTVSNTIDRQTKNLAEEILHTASLGHTGRKFLGDRPDEKDEDILMFTPAYDPKTNVMVQMGQNGMLSTTNPFQFNKVEKQVRADLGKKVKDKKEDLASPTKKLSNVKNN